MATRHPGAHGGPRIIHVSAYETPPDTMSWADLTSRTITTLIGHQLMLAVLSLCVRRIEWTLLQHFPVLSHWFCFSRDEQPSTLVRLHTRCKWGMRAWIVLLWLGCWLIGGRSPPWTILVTGMTAPVILSVSSCLILEGLVGYIAIACYLADASGWAPPPDVRAWQPGDSHAASTPASTANHLHDDAAETHPTWSPEWSSASLGSSIYRPEIVQRIRTGSGRLGKVRPAERHVVVVGSKHHSPTSTKKPSPDQDFGFDELRRRSFRNLRGNNTSIQTPSGAMTTTKTNDSSAVPSATGGSARRDPYWWLRVREFGSSIFSSSGLHEDDDEDEGPYPAPAGAYESSLGVRDEYSSGAWFT